MSRKSIGLSGVQLDGTDIYWLEGRPAEQGRNVLVQHRPGGTPLDVTPKSSTCAPAFMNMAAARRSCATASCYFSHMADQRLYRQRARCERRFR